MPSETEYYRNAVRRLTLAPLVLPCILILPLTCGAQVGSTSASTSSGVGGHAATGAVPSATGAVRPFTGTVAPATGPVRPPSGGPNFTTGLPDSHVTFHGTNPTTGEHRRHHDHPGKASSPVTYGYAIPYAYPVDSGTPDENSDTDDDANYQGGPTVFDRRGSGEDSYVPPVDPVPTPHAREDGATDTDMAAASSEQSRQPTVLIFKDGHQLDLGNYAIIGAFLFDLTPGHPRRIALADLDLEATQRRNDDRGISFQLPPPQAN
jgi:hypothetical protein